MALHGDTISTVICGEGFTMEIDDFYDNTVTIIDERQLWRHTFTAPRQFSSPEAFRHWKKSFRMSYDHHTTRETTVTAWNVKCCSRGVCVIHLDILHPMESGAIVGEGWFSDLTTITCG